jgi:hypothetical protein
MEGPKAEHLLKQKIVISMPLSLYNQGFLSFLFLFVALLVHFRRST